MWWFLASFLAGLPRCCSDLFSIFKLIAVCTMAAKPRATRPQVLRCLRTDGARTYDLAPTDGKRAIAIIMLSKREIVIRQPGRNGVESKALAPVPVMSSMILGAGNMWVNKSFICCLSFCISV